MIFRNPIALGAVAILSAGGIGMVAYSIMQSAEPKPTKASAEPISKQVAEKTDIPKPTVEKTPTKNGTTEANAVVANTWNAGDPAPFKPERAMDYLRQLCKIGPRISGTEGMEKQRELLKKHFENLGATVVLQKFEGRQRSQDKPAAMVNMIVSWHPDAKKRVIFCGHYDTRPIADQEPRRQDWTQPFVSANDGTSTMAFMMELAHHMKDAPKLQVGLDFVIFDAEEWMFDPQRDRFFLGSRYFADQYRDNKPAHRYSAAILLDLFAGKNPTFPWEENSRFSAGKLLEDVWNVAAELKVANFVKQRGLVIQDDHLALNSVEIPAIDIIDFDYPHWHKLSDLPENCSGESMEKVAKVLTVWLQRAK